jgi:hypothetical protein
MQPTTHSEQYPQYHKYSGVLRRTRGVYFPGTDFKFQAAGHLIEAHRYKLVSGKFDSWPGHCVFQLTKSFQTHYGPEVNSASNRNEYQESSWR